MCSEKTTYENSAIKSSVRQERTQRGTQTQTNAYSGSDQKDTQSHGIRTINARRLSHTPAKREKENKQHFEKNTPYFHAMVHQNMKKTHWFCVYTCRKTDFI